MWILRRMLWPVLLVSVTGFLWTFLMTAMGQVSPTGTLMVVLASVCAVSVVLGIQEILRALGMELEIMRGRHQKEPEPQEVERKVLGKPGINHNGDATVIYPDDIPEDCIAICMDADEFDGVLGVMQAWLRTDHSGKEFMEPHVMVDGFEAVTPNVLRGIERYGWTWSCK